MSRPGPDEGAALALISVAAIAALALAAYHLGRGDLQTTPAAAKAWPHGVAFRMHGRD